MFNYKFTYLLLLFLVFVIGCTFCSCASNASEVNLRKTITIPKGNLILDEELPGLIYFDFNFLKLKNGHNAIAYLREDKNCNSVLGIYDLEKREIVKEVVVFACSERVFESKLAIDGESKIYLNSKNGEILVFSSELSLLKSFMIDLKNYDIDGKELSLHFIKGNILFAKEANRIMSIDKRNGEVIDLVKIEKDKYPPLSDNFLVQDIFDFGKDSILIYYTESINVKVKEKSNIKIFLVYNIMEKRVDRVLYYYQTVENNFSNSEELCATYPYFFIQSKDNLLSVINVSKSEMINLVFESFFFGSFSVKVKDTNEGYFVYLLCPAGGPDLSKLYCFDISVINK